MKSKMIRLFMAILICLISSVCTAQPIMKSIVAKNGTQEELVDKKAIMDEYETLIPAIVIKKYIYSNMQIDGTNKEAQIHFALPRFRVEEKNVDKKIFKSSSFFIPYKNINGTSYIDADVAAKICGFKIEEQSESLTLTVNQYSSFNPQILKKNAVTELNGKVLMVWQPTFEEEVDVTKKDKLSGLNVVSPSWFAISNEKGLIRNKVDARYIKAAHAKGYQVWPLITNSFDPDLTHQILQDEAARQSVIKQLAIYARLYGFDGINLDFENIYDEDKNALSEFVKEIADTLKTMGIKISMDVTVPAEVTQWSLCYDRNKLAESLDYMMLMAYDEHWRTSPVSGSVASLPWVERGVINTLKEVPAEKLILGVPFYMREWEENGSAVKAKTLTMAGAEAKIQEKNMQPKWLEEQGQYYFEYEQEGKKYRVWQEEERSLAIKADLVGKYNLAGVAAWRSGFENTKVWSMLDKKLENPVKEVVEVQTKDKKDSKDKKVKKSKKDKTKK